VEDLDWENKIFMKTWASSQKTSFVVELSKFLYTQDHSYI